MDEHIPAHRKFHVSGGDGFYDASVQEVAYCLQCDRLIFRTPHRCKRKKTGAVARPNPFFAKAESGSNKIDACNSVTAVPGEVVENNDPAVRPAHENRALEFEGFDHVVDI